MRASFGHREGTTFEQRTTAFIAKPIALVFAFLAITAITHGVATAEKMRKDCDAVRNLAEIELDSSLILTMAADRDTNTCVFYVSLPPSGTRDTAASQSAGTLQKLLASDDVATAIGMVEAKLVPETLDALLSPLNDRRFQTGESKLFGAAVRERSSAIQQCSLDVLKSRMIFQRVDNIIWCGLSESRKTFIVQASLQSLSIALLLPLTDEQ